MVSISAPVDRYTVSVDEYVRFRSEGFLIVRGLVATDEVQEPLSHVDYLLTGRVEVPGAPAFGADNKTAETRLDHLLRIHMLHRRLEIHERFMLHPRVLDVVQALVGPDVPALQTMLFVKRPGSAGQGYHQDSFHIITQPDTLVGAWLALDPADEENGCLRVTAGSQHEPVYPDVDEQAGHGGDRLLADIPSIAGADDPDERRNALTAVAAKYEGREVAAVVEPGDVVFFGGHVLHRSHANASATRSRRSFVAHYCNARPTCPGTTSRCRTARWAMVATSSPEARLTSPTRIRSSNAVRGQRVPGRGCHQPAAVDPRTPPTADEGRVDCSSAP